MRGPSKLVHHLDPVDRVSTGHHDSCVSGKGDGVAGHRRDDWHLRSRDFDDLRLGAGTGRVDHHGIECSQFIGHQRPPEKIPGPGRQPAQFGRLPPAGLKRRDSRRFPFERLHLAILRKGQGEGARSGEKIGHMLRGADRLSDAVQQCRFPLARGLKKPARRRNDQRATEPLRRRPCRHDRLPLPGQTGETGPSGHPGQRRKQRGIHRLAACHGKLDAAHLGEGNIAAGHPYECDEGKTPADRDLTHIEGANADFQIGITTTEVGADQGFLLGSPLPLPGP